VAGFVWRFNVDVDKVLAAAEFGQGGQRLSTEIGVDVAGDALYRNGL